MINEISMISSNLWTEIDAKLSEIFSTSIELRFADISVVAIGTFLVHPVRGRSIFLRFACDSKANELL